MGTCVAQHEFILCFVFHKAVILSLWLVQLVPQHVQHIWTLSVTVYCLNPPSAFRPTMRSLLKSANNNTCSSDSKDVSVKLIGSPVQHSRLIRHLFSYFRNYPFQYSATLGRCAIKSPIPSQSPWALLCSERASGGCDQSFCVVKWGVECLFKLVVSRSEALSDRWHDSPDPWDGRCDLSSVSSETSATRSPS